MSSRSAMPKERRTMNDDEALRLVVEGTVAETGADFFRALVKNLSAVMDTRGAWVTEYLPKDNRLRALAFWMKDGFVENYEYDLNGTACERVVANRKLIHIPERMIDLFPDRAELVAMNAVSYLGV